MKPISNMATDSLMVRDDRQRRYFESMGANFKSRVPQGLDFIKGKVLF